MNVYSELYLRCPSLANGETTVGPLNKRTKLLNSLDSDVHAGGLQIQEADLVMVLLRSWSKAPGAKLQPF